MQSLVGVSLAIIAVMAVMAVMLVRRGKQIIAAFTLPLISIPVLHLIASFFRLYRWYGQFDIAGLALGVLLCVLLSRVFKSVGIRRAYIAGCCLFMVALLAGYLLN